MISKQAVEEQLKRIGCNFRFWGRSEVNELGRILMEDEVIAECVNGEYSNGFAMLVATNHRLLLVDKKPFLYLTVEDYRYEMITEFNFNHRLMNATANIYTANKTMTFTSWNQHRLRKLVETVQTRVLEMRQQQHLAQQFTAAAVAQLTTVVQGMQGVPTLPAYQAPAELQQPAAARPLQAPAAPAGLLPSAPAGHTGQSPQQRISSRLASGRAALGTYTRSKLPAIRLRREQSDAAASDGLQTGGVLPNFRQRSSLGDFKLPYEYEA